MSNILSFGESVEGYEGRVLNEREVRAGAGILFLFAFLAFLYAYTHTDYRFIKIFVTFFMFDFFTRVMINPKYSPSLIAARIIVSSQNPEYTGAPQKRFAWSIGLVLSVVMFVLVIVLEATTPITFFFCLLCLTLLYCESVFGICVGCKLYTLLSKRKARYCPGGVCEIQVKNEIQTVNSLQIFIVITSLLISSYITYQVI